MDRIIKKATVLRQKNMEWYQFKMTPKEIAQIAYILRKSRNNPHALERKLIKTKVDNIKKAANEDPRAFFPNAIIINIDKMDKVKVSPVNLENIKDEEVKKLLSDDVIIEFPATSLKDDIHKKSITELLTNAEGKVGYINDGQHRELGLLLSNVADSIELNVVASLGASSEIAYKTFADINEKQSKVSKTLLHHIRWEIQEFEDQFTGEAYELVLKLDSDNDSPLQGKIKIFEDDVRRWVSSPSLTDWLDRYIIGIGKPLQDFSNQERLRILKNYFQAWKELYPEQWDEEIRKDYVLTKAMGIHIMCAIFERVLRRCDRYEGGVYDVNNFKRQLKDLKKIQIQFDPDMESPLDWRSKVFGGYSSGKGINFIVKQILLQYPERKT
jgi:DGQHR domain-containing protein